MLGIYKLRFTEIAIHETGRQISWDLEVDVINGRCEPDFEFPRTKDIKDSYEYEIGKDSPIEIKFEGASNGDCYFKSEIEIDGPSEGIAVFFPEILVQQNRFPEKYDKIMDPRLSISTNSPDFAGDYDITYTMKDEANKVSESFSFSVEVIAPE